MKKPIIAILSLLPLLASAQVWKGYTINNQSKTSLVVDKEKLSLNGVAYFSVLWFTQQDLTSADSLILSVRPKGKTLFAAQLRVSSVEGKIQGKVIPVSATDTGWQRIAMPFKSFGVDSARSVRFYISSGDKDGFEFSELTFKQKYTPPVVVDPPTVGKPEKRDSTTFYPIIDKDAEYYLEFIRTGKDSIGIKVKKKIIPVSTKPSFSSFKVEKDMMLKASVNSTTSPLTTDQPELSTNKFPYSFLVESSCYLSRPTTQKPLQIGINEGPIYVSDTSGIAVFSIDTKGNAIESTTATGEDYKNVSKTIKQPDTKPNKKRK